jgi:flagellar basal-body rod modification protein FlgD
MVTAVNGAASALGSPTASSRASVSREQFLRILVAEMTSQNPLEPLDNADFMQQLVGLQSLEQTAALTDSLKTFERFLQMSSGSSMIGRTVKGLDASGDVVQGVVSRVTLEGGVVNVVIGTQKVPIGSVTEIRPQ